MLLNSLKGTIFILITMVVYTSGVACTRADGTAAENGFRKVVSLVKDIIRPPDYVKGGEWAVDCLYDWHAAPPAPVAVAPTGDVYIASEGHIHYFSNTGSFLGGWDIPNSPFRFGYFGLAIAPGGAVFAADHFAGRVYKFAPRGRLISAWEAKVGPLATGPNGDIYASTGRRIRRYNANGVLLDEWGSYGARGREFGLALYLAVGPDGTVYVLDFDFGGVQCFTPEGFYLGMWEPKGRRSGGYKTPRGIAAGPDGNVYIFENPGEEAGCRLDCFTAAGSFLASLGLPESRGTVYGPGIAVAPDGTLYVSDREDKRIRYYKPSRVFHFIRYGALGIIALLIAFSIMFIVRFSNKS